MSVNSILDKIDELTVQTQISDVSDLATGLLELAHRRYPHLVAMYRTVHRKIPRPKTFKAIRWVNPKRMFPGAGLTKEEMQKMSPEELKELAVKLNTYREEAHVIHNRYNQMIDLIERGQLPYFIPYANIEEPSWLKLEGHMGRAKRLKDGTVQWEATLDQQAQDLRSVLLQEDKGKVKFDEIEKLWVDPNGNARAPLFMDVKKKGAAEPLRKQRTVDGKRLRVEPKVFARQFIAVRPDDVGKDEKVGMPPQGNWIDPDLFVDPAQRQFAIDMGAAGMHLLRIPKVPFRMTGPQQRDLHENGQLLTVPPGREKNPVGIFFDSIPAEAVADRPFGRKPPEDSQQVREREPQPEPRPDAGDAGREDRRRARQEERQRILEERQRKAQEGPGSETRERRRLRQEKEEEKAKEREERHKKRAEEVKAEEARARVQLEQRDAQAPTDIRVVLQGMNDQRDVLLGKWNQELIKLAPGPDPTKQKPETAGFTNGKVEGKPSSGHQGIRANMNFTVQVGGKPWIWKIVAGESRGEMFAFMVDRSLGLGAMPAIHFHNFGMKAFREAFDNTHGADALGDRGNRAFQEAIEGGGHLMEFCSDCVEPLNAGKIMKNMMQTKEGRAEFNKLTMIDFATSNPDRHHGNWLIHPDGKMVAIDNALGNFSSDVNKEGVFRFGGGGNLRGGVPSEDWSDVRDENGDEITRDTVTREAGEFFDEHFDADKLQEGARAVNARFSNSFSPDEIVQLREKFVVQCKDNWSNQLSNLGQGGRRRR